MYLQDYFIFLGAILLCGIFAAVASARVKSAYSKYGRVRSIRGISGAETAERIMRAYDVRGIRIGKVGGTLSDHYHPKKAVVNLSQGVHDGTSVADIAVAAHEMGHVMQNKTGYLFYNIRTAIVPVVNVGTFLAMPLVLLGLIIDYMALSANPETGFYLALVGVILYGGSFLFSLVTLPVELNASRRAAEMIRELEILDESEMRGARQMLTAAAMTYLASLLTSLVYFLRFLLYVLSIFGRRDSRR